MPIVGVTVAEIETALVSRIRSSTLCFVPCLEASSSCVFVSAICLMNRHRCANYSSRSTRFDHAKGREKVRIMASIELHVNGNSRHVEADPSTPLLFVLRNQLDLTGAKLGCGLEQCGSCAVLVDGESVLSCMRAVSEFEDNKIVTVEGLVEGGNPSKIQRAFIEENAAQCGYCTPGIVVAVTALLNRNQRPGDAEIREALDGHLCRCGSHSFVLRAIDRLVGESVSDAG